MTFYDWIYFKKNATIQKVRALLKYYFFKNLTVKIGHNVIVKRGKGRHNFGNNTIIFDNSIFEVHNKKATIQTGENCFFSYGVIFVCNEKILLGNNVWIGEYSSLRDSTHNFSSEKVLGELPDKTIPIKIGDNVWIGRGCLILPGTIIEDNVVIAANSVVRGTCEANSIYGGSPAIFIKKVLK